MANHTRSIISHACHIMHPTKHVLLKMASIELPVAEELSCSVCLSGFREPKVLPCCHSFCLHCLEGAHEKTKDHLTCPQCRAQHQVRRVLYIIIVTIGFRMRYHFYDKMDKCNDLIITLLWGYDRESIKQ